MEYLFILGRNPRLSVKEVECFLDRTGNKLVFSELKKNGLLVDVEKRIDGNAIDNLGGVISLGEVICDFNDLDKKEIYLGDSNKLNYVVWDFSEDYEEVLSYLKKRFRKEKLKATEKKFTGRMKMQEGREFGILKSNLIDEQYFIFNDSFGKIVQICDYKKLEERDMLKPVRRSDLAISPRLAKIMINLSRVKERQRLVDGFCGIGVILQEAVLQNIKSIGIDKDKSAIDGAKKNLDWLEIPPEKYLLLNKDSSQVKIRGNVFVAEPDFGDTLRRIIPEKIAKKQVSHFEVLMRKVLKNMQKSISGRFVFTAPVIKVSKNKRIGCDIQKILEGLDLKVVEGFPIPDFHSEKIVGRDIYVLEH